MGETYQEAGMDPTTVKYIEAHVTGTQAGDPVECGALEKIFCSDTRTEPLLLGCLKSNMGHSEGASGVAAMTKACLIFQNNLIPPNILYTDPNPNIKGLASGKLKPVLEPTPFDGETIPLNSFRFGGTNIHTIIKAYGEKLNHNIHELSGIHGINRLILFKSRTEESFNVLKGKILKNPEYITTEYLDLVNTIANLDQTYDYPYLGFFILDAGKKIVNFHYELTDGSNRKNFDNKPTVSLRNDENHDLFKSILSAANIAVIPDGSNSLFTINPQSSLNDLLSFIGRLYIENYPIEVRVENN